MSYSYITLAALRAQLAARLDDPFNIFWSAPELNLYINEALQTFSAFSAFYRNRGTFNTNPNTVFYDLPTNLNSICGYNVLDTTLIPLMCYQLLEPVPTGLGTSGAAWVGTDMYTLDELDKAIERRRNQFLADTGCVVSEFIQSMPSPPIGRVTLSDTVMDIRRAQWISPIGVLNSPYGLGAYGIGPYSGSSAVNEYFNLWKLTEWELTSLNQTWSVNPSQPYGYSVISSPPLTIQVGPVPSTVGSLDIVAVQSGAPLNPQTGVLLGIPDDFAWVIKWGALADLLGMDGQARDPQRATFCEGRYQLGVNLARQAPLALQVMVNTVPQIISSIHDQDALTPNWQGGTAGVVTSVLSAGRNLIAVNPVPLGSYSLQFDVVANATLPTSDGAFIQLGRELIDGLIDYAEHLACFKMGGAEFMITERQATNFMREATVYNERLKAASLFSLPTGNQGISQDITSKRRISGRALTNAS